MGTSLRSELAIMGMSSYFWQAQADSWRIAHLWDRFVWVFHMLIADITGAQLVDRVFANLQGLFSSEHHQHLQHAVEVCM